ncbi:[Fe-Fe] hydrogenase large subunit C-terminal domain-containing protein [Sporosalibacterium faouarense]|uniref:[Fe-Fe] hydrogenase large subunit C-terminal domain-containing protein n=1 Tax=Sporosalibacterium faouarense TaxID=516123 RepID=UPI00192B34DA|nr:[Fe-Fe] hydrogenase large subunit C-terminal domain-containing protein [Sporosalibacterium faouarense]
MNKYFHSVVLEEEKCNGCTNCLRRCPIEAIRVKDKKATIIKERCIDCGECIRVCPYHAQKSITDDLEMLNNFEFNIAIPSMPLYGQFDVGTDMDKVYQGIKDLGFDYIYDEARAADIVAEVFKEMVKDSSFQRPIISALCPAIVRLIQVRFPSLIDNIARVESPMEVAARLAKKEVIEKFGISLQKIGIFYLTQCPAKVTSIRKPIGISESHLNGAISITKLYGHIIKNAKKIQNNETFQKGSPLGVGWARVGGQSYAIGVENYIAVDGIENVINVLEEIELGKLNNLDFFEGLACTGGCVGGPLNVENPFIAKSRIRKLSKIKSKAKKINKNYVKMLQDEGYIGWTENIYPKGIMTLDDDMKVALEKIEKIKEIAGLLPGLDCGSCGSPTCTALAEDIVRGFGNLEDCVFRMKENMKKR